MMTSKADDLPKYLYRRSATSDKLRVIVTTPLGQQHFDAGDDLQTAVRLRDRVLLELDPWLRSDAYAEALDVEDALTIPMPDALSEAVLRHAGVEKTKKKSASSSSEPTRQPPSALAVLEEMRLLRQELAELRELLNKKD